MTAALRLAALLTALPLTAAAMPADQADLDAGALDACVAAAGGGTAALACVGTTQPACVARLKQTYKGVGEIHGGAPCLGAERLMAGYLAGRG